MQTNDAFRNKKFLSFLHHETNPFEFLIKSTGLNGKNKHFKVHFTKTQSHLTLYLVFLGGRVYLFLLFETGSHYGVQASSRSLMYPMLASNSQGCSRLSLLSAKQIPVVCHHAWPNSYLL